MTAALLGLLKLMPCVGRLIRDSRGQNSWTHTLVVPPFALFSAKAILGGLTLSVFGHSLTIPAMSGVDYASFVAPLLAAFAQREFVEKKYGDGGSNRQPTPKIGGA